MISGITNRQLIVLGIVLVIQLVFLWNFILPFQWGQLKVKGLACTCPSAEVKAGGYYLKYITPDSLKIFNLNYSEVYLTQHPSTDDDPMGVDQYIIKGRVIGKKRTSDNDRWTPVIEVHKWSSFNPLKYGLIRAIFFIQLAVFLFSMVFNKATIEW